MRRQANLASAAGGWSARHRGETILAWLAFVAIAFAIGGATGQRQGSVRIGDPPMAAAVRELLRRLESLPAVDQVRSPLRAANRTLRSADGRSLLVTFNVAGDSTRAQRNIQSALAAVAATARSYPQVRLEEFGAASSAKALSKRDPARDRLQTARGRLGSRRADRRDDRSRRAAALSDDAAR